MTRFLFLLLIFAPLSLHADVIISEIMYDLGSSDGNESDAKREWIEVYNGGTSAVDLSDWRFFESGTNHTLTISAGSSVLPPSSYAVIADNTSVFLDDRPHFSGVLFDSSFSLSNTGEILILRDGELNDVHVVSYSSEQGATGDGNSLTWDGSVWSSQAPSPGVGTLAGSDDGEDISDSDENTSDSSATHSTEDSESSAQDGEEGLAHQGGKERDFITIDIEKSRIVTVGAGEFFEARSYRENGEEHPYVSYTWNFGNGVVREGQKVLHQYNYPGDYLVWVSAVSSEKLASTQKMQVSALPADVFISAVTEEYIELENNSGRELDLSLWNLMVGERYFRFPPHTIILPDSRVPFPHATTGLMTDGEDMIALLYPNGLVAHRYAQSANNVYKTFSTDTEASFASQPTFFQSEMSNQKREAESETIHAASVGVVTPVHKEDMSLMLMFAFAGVLGVAAFSVLFLSSSKGDKDVKSDSKLSARDFTIIEKK